MTSGTFDTFETITKTLLTSVISELLPFGSVSLKITIGNFAGEIFKHLLNLKNNEYIYKWFFSKSLSINPTERTIYDKYEEYLINKYFSSIYNCSIIPIIYFRKKRKWDIVPNNLSLKNNSTIF